MVSVVALRSTTFHPGIMSKHERSLDGGASPSKGPWHELPAPVGDRSFVMKQAADAREPLRFRGGRAATRGGSP